MKRMLRQDRVLLESLENKYGTDAIATAIMAIANSKNQEDDEVCGPKEAVLDFIMYVEGIRIRLRELHWMAERNSKHLLTDSMISDIEDFEDNIAEDLMGICGFRIKVGAIVPRMTNQVDLKGLLDEFNNYVINLRTVLENDADFTGIVNELEDMKHKIGKWKYLETLK